MKSDQVEKRGSVINTTDELTSEYSEDGSSMIHRNADIHLPDQTM